jgi:hypothetical protein
MLRKTFLAMAFLLIGVVALHNPVGVSGQTSPVSAQTQVVSSVELKPFDAGGPTVSQAVAGQGSLSLRRINLAVDEGGNLYLAFSIAMESSLSEEPHLVKYDPTGRVISALAFPDFLVARPGGLVYPNSVSIFHDRVYVPCSWRDKENRIRGSILIYTKDGSYEHSVDTPPWFTPEKVMALPTGELFVLGYGPRQVDNRLEYAGADMILKLSPTGRVLASFSPFPLDPDHTEKLLQRKVSNRLLLDPAGHLIHVLPDATMRVFDLDGRLVNTMSPALPSHDFISAVVMRDGVFVVATVDTTTHRAHLTVVGLDGRVVSHTDMASSPRINVEGRDGNYYAIGYLGRRAPDDPPVLLISKVRLQLSK